MKFNKLKNLITSDVINLNEKQIPNISDYNNYIVTTNSDWCALIDPKDRRYFCLTVDCSKAKDKEYFNRLSNALRHPQAGRAFYDLMAKEIPQDWTPDNPPSSEFKEEQKRRAMDSVSSFLEDAYKEPRRLFDFLRDSSNPIPTEGVTVCRPVYMDEDDADSMEPVEPERSGWIRLKDFYILYGEYCSENSMTVIGKREAVGILKKFGINKPSRIPFGVDRTRATGIFIDPEKIHTLKKIFPIEHGGQELAPVSRG